MVGSATKTLLPVAVAVVVAGGCSVYDSSYVFDPGPIDVTADGPGADDEPIHVLVKVVGVRRPDKESQLPASVEVRLRLENTSRSPVTLEPASLVLFSGDLSRFPDPILRPATLLTVAPSESAIVEAYFPFPDGRRASDVDLSGLNLRWTVSIDGHPVTSSASVQRRPLGYYDRYPHRIGVGYQAYP